MNNGTFIIILTAVFPTLAILSFLFSLATYFQPLRARPETRARGESLEELCDITLALVGHTRDLGRMVGYDGQRTRCSENTVRNMASRERRSAEAADDADDEAEMNSSNYEEGGRIGSKRPPRISRYTGVISEEQPIRERAHPTIVGLRMRRAHQFTQPVINGVPMMRTRGGTKSTRNDDDALEAASATEIPPSPEHRSTRLNDTPSILTQLVDHDGNEETRPRILVDEDTLAPLTTWGSYTSTPNGISQPPPPPSPAISHDHIHTSSPFRHQPILILNPTIVECARSRIGCSSEITPV